MNYPTYGYNPRFATQMPAPAFYGGTAPVPGMSPQSVPAASAAQTPGGFAVQPVSSKEEALAVIADPMASGVLLPDLGHGVIYMKRFNPQTGTSDFGEFVFVQPRQEPAAVQYATVEQLKEVMAEIEALKKPSRKEKKNDSDE